MVLTRRQTAGLLAPLVASSGTLPGLKPATAASTPSALGTAWDKRRTYAAWVGYARLLDVRARRSPEEVAFDLAERLRKRAEENGEAAQFKGALYDDLGPDDVTVVDHGDDEAADAPDDGVELV